MKRLLIAAMLTIAGAVGLGGCHWLVDHGHHHRHYDGGHHGGDTRAVTMGGTTAGTTAGIAELGRT